MNQCQMMGRSLLMGQSSGDILWLYKDGDECVDVTGGWEYVIANVGNGGVLNKEATALKMTSPQWSDYFLQPVLYASMSIYEFSYINVDYEMVNPKIYAELSVRENGDIGIKYIYTTYKGIIVPSPAKISISKLPKLYVGNLGYGQNSYLLIKKIWLSEE